mgnify:CR=1 FL=1
MSNVKKPIVINQNTNINNIHDENNNDNNNLQIKQIINKNKNKNTNYETINNLELNLLSLLHYKNYTQGSFHFSFLGITTYKFISGIIIININDFIDDSLLLKLLYDDKYLNYNNFKSAINKLNTKYIDNIRNIKLLQLQIVL